jgi:hypothetical protein
MVWVNFDSPLLMDLMRARVSRSARLLLLEMYAFSVNQLSDGLVDVRLSMISDADEPDALVEELCAAGFVQATQDGYFLSRFLETNATKEVIEASRQKNRDRQERHRKHKNGDHSMCIRGRWCPRGEIVPDVCLVPDGDLTDHSLLAGLK